MPPLPERRNSRVPTISNTSPRSIGRTILRSARDPRSWLLSTLAWGAFDYVVDELLQEDDSIERLLRLQQLVAPRIQLWEQAARGFPHRDLLDDPTSPDYDGRAQTSSLIRAVARMMGARLQDAATGRLHDYSDRGDILYEQLMLPGYVQDGVADDPEHLWNHYAQQQTNRAGTPLANVMVLPLPPDLDFAQNRALVEQFVENTLLQEGLMAHIAIQDRRAETGHYAPVATILSPLKRITRSGEWSEREVPEWTTYQEGPEGRAYGNEPLRQQWLMHVQDFRTQFATDSQREAWQDFRDTLPEPGSEEWNQLLDEPSVLLFDPATAPELRHLETFQPGGARLSPAQWAFDRGLSEDMPDMPRYQMHLLREDAARGQSGSLPTTGAGEVVAVDYLINQIARETGTRLSPSFGREVYDHTHRADVVAQGIVAPPDFPQWVTEDRSQLWGSLVGAGQQAEQQGGAILATSTVLTLPNLPPDELQLLLEAHLQETLADQGHIADYAIHMGYEDGQVAYHAHVFSPMRQLDTSVNPQGEWGRVHPIWENPADMTQQMRETWEGLQREWGVETIESGSLEPEDNSLLSRAVEGLSNALVPDAAATEREEEGFSLPVVEELPDTRVTLQEAAEAFYVGDFSTEGGQTLLPEGVAEPDQLWTLELVDRMKANDPNGEWPDTALAQHHLVIELPEGASTEEQHQWVQDYARSQFTDNGLLAHYVLHDAHAYDPDHPFTWGEVQQHQIVVDAAWSPEEGQGEPQLYAVAGHLQPHAHIAVPVYPVNADGSFAENPYAGWAEPDIALGWRHAWQEQLEQIAQAEAEQEATTWDAGALDAAEVLRPYVWTQQTDQSLPDQPEQTVSPSQGVAGDATFFAPGGAGQLASPAPMPDGNPDATADAAHYQLMQDFVSQLPLLDELEQDIQAATIEHQNVQQLETDNSQDIDTYFDYDD